MSASQNVVILRSRVVKRQDGSFHLWINVWVAKLCDPVIDVNTARLEMSISLDRYKALYKCPVYLLT